MEDAKRIEFLEKKVNVLEAAIIQAHDSNLEQAKRNETLEKKLIELETVIREITQLPIIFLRRSILAGITGVDFHF